MDGSSEKYLWGSSASEFCLSLFDEGSLSKRHALGTWRVVLLWCPGRLKYSIFIDFLILWEWGQQERLHLEVFKLHLSLYEHKQQRRSACFVMSYCGDLFLNECNRTNQAGGQKHCKCFVSGFGKINFFTEVYLKAVERARDGHGPVWYGLGNYDCCRIECSSCRLWKRKISPRPLLLCTLAWDQKWWFVVWVK